MLEFDGFEDLGPGDTDLVGQWLMVGRRVIGDPVANRIDWLIAERLEKIGRDQSGWEVLYRDPRDFRLWVLTYPQSSSHGGGPPRLTLTTEAHAREHLGYGTA